MNANDKLCDSCTYSSAEGYCGNGVLPLLDANYCSLYEAGPRATPNRGRPHWDHPDPILPHQRQRVTGCRVIPINWDGNHGNYCLYLDRYHPHNPGDAMVIDMLQVIEGFSWVPFVLRYECKFDSAYGEQYLSREGQPTLVSVNLYSTQGWGEYKVRAYLHVLVLVTRTKGEGAWRSGTAIHEVPEQFWWLDPTLPPRTLYPMHQLLIRVIQQAQDTYQGLSSYRDYDKRKLLGALLMDTLNLGLELRGRPPWEWMEPVDQLYLQHFKQEPPPEWAIPLWSTEMNLDPLYRGRPHG